MRLPIRSGPTGRAGYTVIEVIVAVFIFGLISASIFNLIANTERIRGRAVFVSAATRLAASEAERLRSIAAGNAELEDSSYTDDISGRTFKVERNVKEAEDPPSFTARAREPYQVEIVVSDNGNEGVTPLRFKILVGQDNP